MPKIGTMEQNTDPKTGEVIESFSGKCDIREIGRFKAVPNDRASSDGAPSHLLIVKDREMGAMWDEGLDRRDRPYYRLKFNGYPLAREVYMRAFMEDDGSFNLDYSAPGARAGSGEAA